jgi:uncharacterized protein
VCKAHELKVQISASLLKASKSKGLFLTMQFINAPVELTQLPSASTISFQPLHPNYRKVLNIEWLITTLVLFAIALALSGWVFRFRILPSAMLLGGALLIAAVYWFFMSRSFPLAGYALRERDVVYKRGWLVQSVRMVPFVRIQNCTVKNGPLERKYGLASLTIYTAGSSGADLQIPGLTAEEADQMRQFILSQINKEDEGI